MTASSERSPLAMLPVLGLLAVLLTWTLNTLNSEVQEPYMDEIFHVPQAQKYCSGRFHEWDPKITTFPGLYLVATVYAKLAAWTGAAFCSLSVLRSVNVLFTLCNVALCVLLRRHIAPQDPHAQLHALRVALFPPLLFFAFLFYTDAGATFFVLLMLLLAERVDLRQYPPARGSFVLSAVSGAVAVLFRQTNIMWVVFVAGTVVVRCAELAHGKFIYGSAKQETAADGSAVVTHSSLRVLINFVVIVVSNVLSIIQIVWPFVVIVAGFAVFLVVNGGIVVGDKSNHEVTFHGAQVLYFIVVAATGFGLSLAAPRQLQTFLGSVGRTAKTARGMAFVFFLAAVTVGIIWRFSPVHKFMLADNRHYTFYVWRKFFLKHSAAKFLPAPLYLYFGWRCWAELGWRRSMLWKLVYALAVLLVLTPSPLVEPRYYCVPFVILHLNTGSQPALHQWIVVAAYTVVNAVTLYIFVYRPYLWVDGSTARFMW